MNRPLLVGWSYGAFIAAHWASQNPDRTVGALLVDGAYPYDWLDEAVERRIRKLWRWSWFMVLLRPFGMAPRMNAERQATGPRSEVSSAFPLAGPLLTRRGNLDLINAIGTTCSSWPDREVRARHRLAAGRQALGSIDVDIEGELAQLGPTGYRPLRVP